LAELVTHVETRRVAVPAGWAAAKQTHPAVAMAIHAISSPMRSAEAIWDLPTSAECEEVKRRVQAYISEGAFPADPDGIYEWGLNLLVLAKGRNGTATEV